VSLHSPSQSCEQSLIRTQQVDSSLLKEIESLRKALEFYAYEANKESGIFARGILWDDDKGKLARKVLEKNK
jgi:hypothetical protein